MKKNKPVKTSVARKLRSSRKAVGIVTALFLSVWLAINIGDFTGTQNGLIRFVLGTAFALAILFRPKKENAAPFDFHGPLNPRSHIPVFLGVTGALIALAGIVFNIHQLEWLGILILLSGCLKWALPAEFATDIFLSLFLFYWIHPLPGQVFGTLQLTMQKMSVSISEWFLHLINVRVWADGLVLRTGLKTYEIPEWCSGMRTATTVFILSIGLGILKRLRIHQCLAVTVLAVLQALVLNVLRISTMVAAGPFADDATDMDFLHDAAGIIIITAVLLVWLEISLFKKSAIQKLEDKKNPNWQFFRILSGLPPFWRMIAQHKAATAFAVAVTILGAVAVFKSRPYHRAAMLKPVAEALRDAGDFENAERLACIIRRKLPLDDEWLMEIARLHLMRGKYREVLDEMPRIPEKDRERAIEKNILTAYSYMGLGNIAKSSEVMRLIPQDIKDNNPMLAMVVAEVGMYSNDPEQTARYIVRAREWKPNLRRIRRIYPYLRTYRKWSAIKDADTMDVPHSNIEQSMCAAEAYMIHDESAAVASICLHAIAKWPHDPRILTPLFYMTLKRDDPDWEGLYADHLRRCIKTIEDPSKLYSMFDNCFNIKRPDLAWAIYHRIEEIDPDHPALLLSAIRFGDKWFVFRRRFLGFIAGSSNQPIDIKPLYYLSKVIPAWEHVCSQIPLGNKLSDLYTIPARQEYTRRVLREFDRRDRNGTLSEPMRFEYVRTLEIAGRVDEAREQLRKSAKETRHSRNKAVLSEILERKGQWYDVYETLHDIFEPGFTQEYSLTLSTILRLCRAQYELRLGIAAIATAREAARRYPEFPTALYTLAVILAEFDDAEEALSVLNTNIPVRSRELEALKARILHDTQRFKASERLCRSTLTPPIPLQAGSRQAIVLPPAELALHYHESALPSDEEFAATARQIEENLPGTTSPFLSKLLAGWLEVYKRNGPISDLRSQISDFSAFGRTDTEKSVALHQLAMLLCHKKEFDAARKTLSEAVKHMPHSPILWRMLISLSDADPAIISEARAKCPDSSDIWLASVVSEDPASPTGYAEASRGQRTGDRGQRTEDRGQQTEDSSSKLSTINYQLSTDAPYTAAALTRAAEYLFRQGRTEEASAAARQAVAKAQSLLPAYMMGARCALKDGDNTRASACVQGCLDSALVPLPAFYETFVDLKADGTDIDTDASMVNALSNLRAQYPDNPLWSEMLGYVQYIRGGENMVDTMYYLTAAMDAGSTNRIVYVLGGEAARKLGNLEKASELLREGRKHYPDDITILNNLVYTLAQDPTTAGEALGLVSELVRMENSDPDILDTVATAYLNADRLERAEEILLGLVKRSETASPEWFRANMKLADAALRRGHTAKANTLLTEILRSSEGIPDEDVKAANNLLSRCEEELQD